MIGPQLRQLRLARGLSMDALVAEIGGIVTKQALSKYELGKAKPSPVVLNKIAAALGVKAARLWSQPSLSVQLIAYRKGSRLSKKEQTTVEHLVNHTLEQRVRLQELVRQRADPDLPVQSIAIKTVEDAESAAGKLRQHWHLGLAPIDSIVGVLEDHHIHVLEIDANERFDGICAVAYDVEDSDRIGEEQRMLAAAVVTRRGVAGERQRLNLAHEIGHLVLRIPEEVDEEKAAFRFGAAFLAPAETVRRAVGARRAFTQLEELLLLKRRFGMSLQALLYRLHDLNIITDSYYKQWCMDINRLGYRKKEPGELPPEQPQWLQRNALRALSEGLITHEEAQEMLGEAVRASQPLSLIQRSAFMKLPLEERRRILAEQAEKTAAHYEEDSEWKQLQGGDIVEY